MFGVRNASRENSRVIFPDPKGREPTTPRGSTSLARRQRGVRTRWGGRVLTVVSVGGNRWGSVRRFCCCCCWVLSCVRLFATPWTVAHQGSPSMGFSRPEYWRVLPFPPPGDLPHPGMEPTSPALAGGFFTTEPPGKLRNPGSEQNAKIIPPQLTVD